MKRHDINTLAMSVLTPAEYNNIINIASMKDKIFDNMADFDSKLGGAGIHNINQEKTGRYHGKDRDVYRPIQYIYSYIQMDSEQVDWVTREIIRLHLESLIKRLTRITRLPLGQALTLSIVRTKLDDNFLY